MSLGRQVRLPHLVPPCFALLNCAVRLCLSLVLLVGLVGCSNRGNHKSPGAGELWLTAADESGHDPFMPSVATPQSGKPLPGPELTPQGNGTEVVAQQQPGGSSGSSGGSLNNAECDGKDDRVS